MIVSFALPVLAAAGFGLAAPGLGRRLHPAVAVWALALGGWACTAAGLLAAVAVAVAGLGRLPALASLAHWSPAAMRLANPYPPAVGVVAALAVVALSACAALAAVSGGRRLRNAWSVAARLPHDLVVCDDPEPFAYTVPGWPGRIVVSRALLRSLDARGRRALLAHERTHLRGRDDLHLYAARVCAALNPLLRRLPAAVAAACERRADHAAAELVGDRRAVAEAIATAVLPQTPAANLCAAGGDVTERVVALLAPTRRGLLPLGALLTVVAGSAASALWLCHDVDAITDAAALLFGRTP